MYGGEPPCEGCPKPQDLDGDHVTAFKIWHLASAQRGYISGMAGTSPAALTVESVFILCEIYDLPCNVFESILLIDRLMLPYLRQQQAPKES